MQTERGTAEKEKTEAREVRWVGGWERWNAEVGEGTAERGGGEGDEEEAGEVHMPYGGLTEAM